MAAKSSSNSGNISLKFEVNSTLILPEKCRLNKLEESQCYKLISHLILQGLLSIFTGSILYLLAAHFQCSHLLGFMIYDPRIRSVGPYLSLHRIYWYIPECLQASLLLYVGLGSTGEYQGGTSSKRPRSRKISKNKIFKAALCLARYLFCTKAEHPDNTCATLSGTLLHNRHCTSFTGIVLVFWLWYSLVGNSCS